MIDFEDISFELPFKVLKDENDSFLCSLDADEGIDPGKQHCWRIVDPESAGIR